MNRIARRALIAMVLVFVLVAGIVFFLAEYLANARNWVMFPGSPHVYERGKLSEGLVLDREGALLLDYADGRTYPPNGALRKAMLHWTGDRQGNIQVPALHAYTKQMVGYDLLNGVYHYGNTAGRVQLTLSAQVQVAAMEAMGSHKGTVAVYNYKTGELICAVSAPAFDPENVPNLAEDTEGTYEGVYLNRFLQSVYIPGSIFKIVTTAATLETMPELQHTTFSCNGEYEIGSGKVTCEHSHGEQSLKDAFRNSCNCAFAKIVEEVGRDKLARYAAQFRVTEPVTFDGITTAAGNFDISQAYGENLAWSGIGQYTDQINPCAYLTFVGAIAEGGSGVQPHVVANVTSGSTVTYTAKTAKSGRIMSEYTAQILRDYMRNNVASKYGDENFGGLTVCAKTGTGEVGGGKKPNAMFTGFVADEQYPLAFIVAVEDGGYGATVCIPILSKVLAACVDAKVTG